jgi:multidrug efflux pump subunit AcrA (membrane-fusion protein)
MKKIVVLMMVIATLVMTGCNINNAGAPKAAAEVVETLYAVNTAVVEKGNVDAYLEFGGDVAAASTVDVMPDAAGKVSRIYVRVGQFVERNQLIAEVDPSRPGMTYSLSPVRSPISGTVTSLPFSVGSTVAQSLSLARIASANDLEITVEVAERFISRVAMGQSAQLVFDAYPGEVFNARVVEISPVLNTTSRTETVKLSVAAADRGRIKIGMYARVKLVTEAKKNIITVPYDSLVRRNEDIYVFKRDLSANIVNLIPVKVGIRVDDVIEIQSGLYAGDEIVIKGQTLLNDGSKVNVISTTTIRGNA